MEHISEAWEGKPVPAPLNQEARHAPRFTLLLRAAKLILPAGEFLCVIRDVSATGLSIRNFHALPPGGPIKLQLQSGDSHELEKMWERDGAAGFRFGENVNLVRFLSENGSYPKRPVRLNLQLAINLALCGEASSAEIRDISQQGARITSESKLAIGQSLQLNADSLPAIRAKVRWRKENEYGLVFEDTFQFAELACLAAALQLPNLV
ncbi:PilZ domain-containing protein [Altererythrobacter sp. ZODW24]|uniref:PilZ domain-containing protein n=1 Tax=Altererythrobacter sp. ZODW24 TaxID=2185142 RepID=UPI000DF72848|nr:PilZ domain-containing protein [Altererythrobacter sp. ZODW24]